VTARVSPHDPAWSVDVEPLSLDDARLLAKWTCGVGAVNEDPRARRNVLCGRVQRELVRIFREDLAVDGMWTLNSQSLLDRTANQDRPTLARLLDDARRAGAIS
jgi:hypothetical protein